MKSKNGRYESDDPPIVLIIIGVIVGLIFFMVLDTLDLGIIKHITKDTMNDICKNLNPENSSVEFDGYLVDGKLVCVYPSYGNTKNIKFKSSD